MSPLEYISTHALRQATAHQIIKDTYRKLKREAKKRDITISELTRLIIDGYFERRKTDAVIEEFLTVIMSDPELGAAIKKKVK